jgi:hypothetical protein
MEIGKFTEIVLSTEVGDCNKIHVFVRFNLSKIDRRPYNARELYDSIFAN